MTARIARARTGHKIPDMGKAATRNGGLSEKLVSTGFHVTAISAEAQASGSPIFCAQSSPEKFAPTTFEVVESESLKVLIDEIAAQHGPASQWQILDWRLADLIGVDAP